MRALAVAAAVAVLAACWFGWSALSASGDDALEVARERDAAVADVSKALVTLNTIDHRSAGKDVAAWLGVAAGKFGKDLRGDRQLQIERARKTETVATARLADIAVTRIGGGTATLLAVLDVRIATHGKAPKQRRSRLTVDATRTDAGWKVTGVQAVQR